VISTNEEATASASAHRYVAELSDTVPGWLLKCDARVLQLTHEAQRACGISGDILEVGTFMGKCAILLGYFCDRPSERLVVSDIFDGDEITEQSKDWRRNGVQKPQRDAFAAQYGRFHNELPEVITGPSCDLDPDSLGRQAFRLIHIDGAHDWANVQADIGLAEALASDDAILVFDDVSNAGFPAVGARVWAEVLSGRLHPIAVTGKLYATANPRSPVADVLRSRIRQAADLRTSVQTIDGHEVLVVSQLAGEDPARLRPRPPSWKRVVRDLSPPLLYRGTSRLSKALRRRAG
jgi:predicted O-methyltransferase YrrM